MCSPHVNHNNELGVAYLISGFFFDWRKLNRFTFVDVNLESLGAHWQTMAEGGANTRTPAKLWYAPVSGLET